MTADQIATAVMRITVRSMTLGGHTHLMLSIEGRQATSDPVTMRNEYVPAFLTRLQPEALTDETPHPHEPIARRWWWEHREQYIPAGQPYYPRH